MSHQKEFTGGLGAFLGFGRDILDRNKVSVIDLFGELHGLKEKRRNGWVKRNIPFPESVADHVYGCLLIAQAFLPEDIENEPNYSKEIVLKMLLLHDLTEGIASDLIEKKEHDLTERGFIAGRVHLFNAIGIYGLSAWSELGIRYINKEDINSKIASDIDTLDTYLQLIRYDAMPDCKIPDAQKWAKALKKKLLTNEGKIIFKIFDNGRSETTQ